MVCGDPSQHIVIRQEWKRWKNLRNQCPKICLTQNQLCVGILLPHCDQSIHYAPHPVALMFSDNTETEAWIIKASKSSLTSRALGRIQAALMSSNPVDVNDMHVTAKGNIIANRISCVPTEDNLPANMQPLFQDYPQLRS